MSKIAVMGTIHNDGLMFLKKHGYDILEITNFSEEELKKNLHDVKYFQNTKNIHKNKIVQLNKTILLNIKSLFY